jgi:hypothetical protein
MTAAATRTARVFLTLLLPAAVLGGCSKSMTGPDPDPDPDPAPVLTTFRDLEVEIRYIDVRASCDEDFLGNFDPGEFQYRIDVAGYGQLHMKESRGYNTVSGENFQRNAGTTINFANETYTFRSMGTTTTVEVSLAGAEWDGLRKDDRMANRRGTVTVPFKVGKETRRITIGADGDTCQIALVYDATWTERTVGN